MEEGCGRMKMDGERSIGKLVNRESQIDSL